jgi:hypothetical protein
MAVLRPAQRFRLTGGIEHGLGAAGPAQQPLRRFEPGPLAARGDSQQAAVALHHHAARLAQRCANQRDPGRTIGLGNRADPFGSGPGLAKTAPGQDQPGQPVTRRR